MIFFTKLLFGSLRGIDPVIFLALICLGLSVCFIALFVELEKTRMRWLENRTKFRSFLPPSAVPRRLPPDRQD